MKPVRVDLEGIGGRIVALPIPTRSYVRLQAGENKLFYSELVKQQRTRERDRPERHAACLWA